MDTTLLWTEKRVFNAVGITLNFFMVGILTHSVFMPIMANDLIAKIPTPTLDVGQVSMGILTDFSTEAQIKQFDENTKKKYPKSIIIDVDRGIKHIKLTKYYDGKPVKINIIEIDKNLAKNYELIPALASDTLNNKEQIANIAKENNSIIALLVCAKSIKI